MNCPKCGAEIIAERSDGLLECVNWHRCDANDARIAELEKQLAVMTAERDIERKKRQKIEGDAAAWNSSYHTCNGERMKAIARAAAAEKQLADVADWLQGGMAKPPQVAFTAGESRRLADLIVTALEKQLAEVEAKAAAMRESRATDLAVCRMALKAVAEDASYKCQCGEPPYTDGERCPPCFARHALDDVLVPLQQRQAEDTAGLALLAEVERLRANKFHTGEQVLRHYGATKEPRVVGDCLDDKVGESMGPQLKQQEPSELPPRPHYATVGLAAAKVYTYSFVVWPDETGNLSAAVFTLFEVMRHRVEVEMTEPEFAKFRLGLRRHYLTLREIERVPHHVPERVE